MKWYVCQDGRLTVISEYFDYNLIEYKFLDLWHDDPDGGGHNDISEELLTATNSGLIVSGYLFNDLLSQEPSRQRLLDFLNRDNILWVGNDSDGFWFLNEGKDNIIKFDELVPNNKLCFFIDGNPYQDHWCYRLKNIQILETKYHMTMKQIPRIFNAYTDKINATKDFMMTTVNKSIPSKLHRQILWDELNNRPGLIDRGHAVFRKETDPWHGHTSEFHGWKGIYISSDFYLDSWLEIVPETFYQHGHVFTEKNLKPIITKTPFLIVSSKGYLDYLKSLGFQTFHTLIDESYDKQDKIEDRVRLLVDQLEDIIKNGSKSFYQASRDILEHNYSRSCEISGMWQHEMDLVIRRALDRINHD
jgi:hypothetical protein